MDLKFDLEILIPASKIKYSIINNTRIGVEIGISKRKGY